MSALRKLAVTLIVLSSCSSLSAQVGVFSDVRLLDPTVTGSVVGRWRQGVFETSQTATVLGVREFGDTVYTVGAGKEFATVQAALDAIKAATPTNGTTDAVVLIYPGTYRERVSVETTGVTLRGVARDACTIVTSSGVSTIWGTTATVWVKADRCRVENITIQNVANLGGGGTAAAVMALKVNDTLSTFSRFDAIGCRFVGDSGTVLVTGPWNTSVTTGAAVFRDCDIYGGDTQGKNVLLTYRGYDIARGAFPPNSGSVSEWRGGTIRTRYAPGGGVDSPLITIDRGCTHTITNAAVHGAGQKVLFAPVVDAVLYASSLTVTGDVDRLVYSISGTSPNVNIAGVSIAAATSGVGNVALTPMPIVGMGVVNQFATTGVVSMHGSLAATIPLTGYAHMYSTLESARDAAREGADISKNDFTFQRNGKFGDGYSLSGSVVRVVENVVDAGGGGSNLTDSLVSEMWSGRNHFVAVNSGTTVTTLARDGTLHTSGTIRSANDLVAVDDLTVGDDAAVSGTLNVSGPVRAYSTVHAAGNLSTSSTANLSSANVYGKATVGHLVLPTSQPSNPVQGSVWFMPGGGVGHGRIFVYNGYPRFWLELC
jgi:hypothetical protein